MKAEVKAIRHKNVLGKELLYIVISKGNKEVMMNVGEKSFKGVEEMEKIAEIGVDLYKDPKEKK